MLGWQVYGVFFHFCIPQHAPADEEVTVFKLDLVFKNSSSC
jgi:hypothetical protein